MDQKRLNIIVNQWLTKAENDLLLVEQGFSSSNPITDALCFHCQQAVEKYLKVFCISRKTDYPKVHDIARLMEACIAIDTSFESLRELSYLSNYAVDIRYPDDFYIPSLEELQKAYEDAKKVKVFVMSRCKT